MKLFFNPILGVLIPLVIICPLPVHSIQPVDVISADPARYYVRQGPAQCGPASFYMIFKYYGDDRGSTRYADGNNGSLFDMTRDNAGGADLRPGSPPVLPVVRGGSAVSSWMKGSASSTNWGKMSSVIRNLHYLNNDGKLERYYTNVESCDTVSPNDNIGYVKRGKDFLERIVPLYLDRNRPVIVHLKRHWPFPGHYIVIVGYDRTKRLVYYMDPGNSTNGLIHSVAFDDYIGTYWYLGISSRWWGKARWSGRWIGFYRNADQGSS